jgi:hypothetical protein
MSRTEAMESGRALKTTNALTALFCAGLPAAILALEFPSTPARCLV